MASIEKRGKNSFRLIVELGYDSNGKRIKRSKTVKCKGITEARKELAKFQTEVEAGEYIAPEKMLLKDFVKEWEEKYAVKELEETTLTSYLSLVKNHILPAMGNMRIDQIKPMHVIKSLDGLKRKDGKDEPLSNKTIQSCYEVMRNIFERAVNWKIIKENPAASVKKPRKKSDENEVNESRVYDEEEVEILFKAIQNEPFHWRVFISLALAAGLRRSELLGLEWKNVDLENGTIYINRAVVKGRVGAHKKGPKSKTSRRIVTLPDSLIKELNLYREHWLLEKEQAGDHWLEEEHEYLFCNINGKHFYPTTPSTWWRRFVKRAKIRYICLHDLRHTSATLLINEGIHAKVISERLGHADIRITMDVYGHVLQKADKEAANKLDSLFSTNLAED